MKRSSTPLVIGSIVALIVVAAVVALALTGGDDDDATASGELSSPAGDLSGPAAAEGIDGTPLPAFPDGPDPAIGLQAPLVTGVDFDGAPVTISPDGDTKVVVFLAHWCPHCQREVPVIQDWIDDGNLPDGVQLIGVATAIDENRPNYPPDEWLERERWSSAVIHDPDNAVAQAMGLTGFPYWVVLDGENIVAVRAGGELPMSVIDGWLAEMA